MRVTIGSTTGDNVELSYIQKEMHTLRTETTRSSDYLLYLLLAQTRCCLRRWLRHHEKPQCEERSPGRPLQPLLQNAAAVQQVPEEQQHEQHTD